MHWPVAQKKGTKMPKVNEDWVSLDEVPLWETYSEMEKLYNQGICKAIGVSNFNEEKLGKLISKTQVVPAVNQVECHPLLNQKDLINYCSENNISVTAYSPLGAEFSNGSLLSDPRIVEISAKLNATPAQVLLAWQLARGVVVIPKSVHEDRIKENFGSLSLVLDSDDIKKIDEMNENHRFITGEVFINPSQGYDKIF
jgi:alcohol dehydrogenase (NADP+)